MAELVMTSSGWSPGRLRVTYETFAGGIKITKLEGCRTDGYTSYLNSATTVTFYVVSGYTQKVALSNHVRFSANSSYYNWALTNAIYIFGSGSTTLYIKLPTGSVAWSGATFSGTFTLPAYTGPSVASASAYSGSPGQITYSGSGSQGSQFLSSLLNASGYSQVNYISASGSSGINTGLKMKGTTCIECAFQYTSATTQQRVFGTGADNDNLVTHFYINGNGSFAWSLQNSSGNWQSLFIQCDNKIHTVKMDGRNGVLTLDGVSWSISTSRSNTSSGDLVLFGRSNATNYMSGYIYGCRIYDNGTLVRNFIPARRNSDGAYGLFDIQNWAFYTSNTGTALGGTTSFNSPYVWNINGNINAQSGTKTGLSTNTYYTCSFTVRDVLGLTASWSQSTRTLGQWTVSYNASGGTSTPSSQTKNENTNITLASAISKNKSTNTSWAKITYDANSGSVSPTSNYATRTTTYTFNGWKATNGTVYSANGTYSANEGTTMTAQWTESTSTSVQTPTATRSSTPLTRTVSFNKNGGDSNPASLISNATTTYTAKGWYTATSGGSQRCANGGTYAPTGAETVHQQWNSSTSSWSSITLPNATKAQTNAPNRVVTFNATTNGGALPSGTAGTATSSAKISYTLEAWYDAASGGNKIGEKSKTYTPSGNITLYAHWTPTTGTYSKVTLPNATKSVNPAERVVTLNPKGGTCSPLSLTSQAPITCTLKGWYTAASGGTSRGTKGGTYTPSQTETIYAQFNETAGSYSSVTLPTPTKTGYKFLGWSTNENDTNGIEGSFVPSASQIMYAIWEEDQPTSVQFSISHVTRTKIRFSCSCEGVNNPIFTLYYQPSGGSAQTYTVPGSGTSRENIVFTGLNPGTSYTFWIKAENSIHTASSTSTKQSKTTLVNIPSNLVLNLSNIKYSSLNASCSATGDTNANITNYTVYWRKKPIKPVYDMPLKVLSDGSCWARIFYHNNKEGTVFFSNENIAECKNIQTQDKYSRLYLLDDNTYKRNGAFELMLCYPNFTNEYNRWKQTKTPCDTYIWEGEGSTVPGYEGINTSWSSNRWGGLEKNKYDPSQSTNTYLDGSVGSNNWFYAVGAFRVYKDVGIPGPDDTKIISGPVELWIRIDDDEIHSKSLGTSTSTTIDTLDDLTKYIVFFSATNSKGNTNWSSSIEIETYQLKSANVMMKNGWPHNQYEKLDYIKSTTTQWIDSGINPLDYNGCLTVDADIEFTSTSGGASSSNWQTIIGASYGLDNGIWYWNPQYHLAVNGNNKFAIEYPLSANPGTSSGTSIVSDITAGTTRHRVTAFIDRSMQTLKVDGFMTNKEEMVTGGPNCNLYIFARNYVNPESGKVDRMVGAYGANLKLYHLTIKDTGGNVLRDFFPCKRKSDNKYGLYDTATDTFFTDLHGQQDFIPGNVEIWNKGHLLYKQNGTWRKVKTLYVKSNSDHQWHISQ